MKIRKPAVAGRFYPATKNEIIHQLDDIYKQEQPKIDTSLGKHNLIGCVVPHAGYMFSAYHAMHFFHLIKPENCGEKYDTFVIVNPNHTGVGDEIALDDNDGWHTPLGTVPVDNELGDLLGFNRSANSHRYEHSGEVMVPLLQYSLDYDFKILPITLSKQNHQNAAIVAKALHKAVQQSQRKIVFIASSDFSHYVDPEEGKKLDQLVIDEIVKLNSTGVQSAVVRNNISVCGYGPVMTLIEYAKLMSDNPKTKILRRGHSGEAMPASEVVDYVSMLFYSE